MWGFIVETSRTVGQNNERTERQTPRTLNVKQIFNPDYIDDLHPDLKAVLLDLEWILTFHTLFLILRVEFNLVREACFILDPECC